MPSIITFGWDAPQKVFVPGEQRTLTCRVKNETGISTTFFTRAQLSGSSDGSTVGDSTPAPIAAGQTSTYDFDTLLTLPGTPGLYSLNADLWWYYQGVWRLAWSGVLAMVTVVEPIIKYYYAPASYPVGQYGYRYPDDPDGNFQVAFLVSTYNGMPQAPTVIFSGTAAPSGFGGRWLTEAEEFLYSTQHSMPPLNPYAPAPAIPPRLGAILVSVNWS